MPYRFGMDLSLHNHQLLIERSGDNPSKIFVKKAPNELLPLSETDGNYFCSNENWVKLLGKYNFNLSDSVIQIKNSPTFRALLSYFIRSPKGFDSPEKFFPQQSTWSIQVALTYLLKLDWKVAREFEEVRQKDKLIKALKVATNEGTLGDIMGSAPDLRTEILLKKNRLGKLARTVADFKVLPEYQEKEQRASDITKKLASLSAEDTTDKEWLGQLERALQDESDVDHTRVEKLFDEASIDLPEMVTKRFEEVSAFHTSIVRNRKEHLKQEMEDIQLRINNRFSEKQALDNERASIFAILQTHGALDQYTKFQAELSKLEAEVK